MSLQKKLEARHHMIKRLKATGYSNKEIAERVNLTEKTIASITSQPLFKKALQEFTNQMDREVIETVAEDIAHDPVKEIFDGAKVTAAQNIVNLANGADSEPVQHKASLDVLAFSGYKPVETAKAQTNIFIGEQQAIVLNEALNDISLP